jgi:hypothetical protein
MEGVRGEPGLMLPIVTTAASTVMKTLRKI